MSIIIRQTKKSEYREISDITICLWHETYCGLISDTFLKSLSIEGVFEKRLCFLTSSQRFSIVALFNKEIVGFCDFGISRYPNYGKGEIYAIYVKSQYQGMGVGRMLMQNAITNLNKNDLRPYVAVVLEENTIAKKFYKNNGFSLIDNCPIYIGQSSYPGNMYVKAGDVILSQEGFS